MIPQVLIECRRECGVPIMNQITLGSQKPVTVIRELASALLHEGRGWMRCDPGNLNPSRAQLHHHQDIVGHGF